MVSRGRTKTEAQAARAHLVFGQNLFVEEFLISHTTLKRHLEKLSALFTMPSPDGELNWGIGR